MEALQQPSIQVIAVIAEGVPEGDTKQLIAYAAKHNKIVLGPATVGGLQVCLCTHPMNIMTLPQSRAQGDIDGQACTVTPCEVPDTGSNAQAPQSHSCAAQRRALCSVSCC